MPNRTLKTSMSAPTGPSSAGGSPSSSHERRESTLTASQPAILPVVEEAAEGISTAAQSRNSHVSSLISESDGRPLTPAKDGEERDPGFGNPILGAHRFGRTNVNGVGSDRSPPTPPKSAYSQVTVHGKPESADSGYGVGGNFDRAAGKGSLGPQRSFYNIRAQLSRESLDKALPPLPRGDAGRSAF